MTEQHDAEERSRYLANFDSLTGRANRRYFNEQLEREIAGSVESTGLISQAVTIRMSSSWRISKGFETASVSTLATRDTGTTP